jgi:hypothetical protein
MFSEGNAIQDWAHLLMELMLLCRPLNQIPNVQIQHKEQDVENKEPFIYTEEQLMARLKFFIGVCLALTLVGIVFVVLYSLIFVTQPLNAISPIDQKFFELIVPIATFLTGTLTGIMLSGAKKEDQDAMMAAQKQAASNAEAALKSSTPAVKSSIVSSGWTTQPLGSQTMPGSGPFANNSFTNPGQQSWTATEPSNDITTGFGGKPAPPPVTDFPER